MNTLNFFPGEFFLAHLPSFTRLGFECRRRNWPETAWDFTGQRWLVTGASTGIGAEIARQAAMAGAHVLAVARSTDKLAALATQVHGKGTFEPWSGDLALIDSVAPLSAEVARRGTLDVVVNNVGVLLDRPEPTRDGNDRAFATNLLVPYALTRALLNLGLVAPDGAIVHMSSGGMYSEPLRIDRLAPGSGAYDGVRAYARHKRAQVALNEYWRTYVGAARQSYVMHPGWADTPGVATSLPTFRMLVGSWLRDAAGGADTALWLAQHRPVQSDPSGIWFDRALRPAHAFAATRNGDDVAALVRHLDDLLDS